jgi:hypothetical protein
VAEIVYVLVNEAMPGLVKIGRTENVERRLQELSTTNVPLPFECHYAVEVDDAGRIEKILHGLFGDVRVNPKREFFRVDREKVVLAMKIGDFKEVTPAQSNSGEYVEDKEERDAFAKSLEKERSRRSKINLGALGIGEGATLTFSRDGSVVAVVAPGNKVRFKGQIMSLSAAALSALHDKGNKTSAASGSDYWMFDGETLDELRRKREAEAVGQDTAD